MISVAAGYGYCGSEHPVETWDADHYAATPLEIWPIVQRLFTQA